MKLFIGWVATSGVLLGAAAADAQGLVPYRIGAAPMTVSDVGGPYAALPPDYDGPRYAPPALPPRAIDAIVREMGYEPLGAPQQRGAVYTVSAINIDGEDGRVVLDARNGRILRFIPAYRMGDRMGEEVVTTYGPAGAMPELPQYRRAPQPNVASPQPRAAAPKVASRTPSVPLPKAPLARAVATPAKPVAAPVAVAVPPAAPAVVAPAVPAEQQAVVAPKPDEVRVIPMTPPPAAEVAPAPTVAAPAVEAKPATPAPEAAPAAPPVQGAE
jgi:hypothetical protein